MELFDFFTLPFMHRALVSGTIIGILLGWLGVFVVTRKMSFIGDGVAHSSLAAIAFALLLGWSPLPAALIFALIIGTGLYFLEKKTSIGSDASIGIMFTFGMALGIILLQYHHGYAPELISFLFGSILSVSTANALTILIVGCIALFTLYTMNKKFAFIAIDNDGAQIAGIQVHIIDFLFYNLVSVAIILSVKLVGVILVSALLIIPSSIGKLLSKSFAEFQYISTIASVCIVWIGLILSVLLDWPSGAAIVMTGIICLLSSFLAKKYRRGQ